MSCQIPYVLELPKASVQRNESGPLGDGDKELLPEAIVANCVSSKVTYWQLGSDRCSLQ